MDTGRLDSHIDFGINAPPNDRITFRRVTTYAPLQGIPTSLVNDTESRMILVVKVGGTQGSLVFNNAGFIPGFGLDIPDSLNYTFAYVTRTQYDGTDPSLL
jgi:hypothetical protein